MFEDFTGVKTGLTTADIAALQGLYGARQPDAFDAKAPNDVWTAATQLNPSARSSVGAWSAVGDISTGNDVDWYQFKAQGTSNTITIRLQTSSLSLLMPRLSVFDARLNPLGLTVASDHSGSDLVLQLNGATPGTVYYVNVEGGTSDVFGIGAYQLSIGGLNGSSAGNGGSAAAFWQGVVNDNNLNTTMATATPLTQRYYQADPRFDYTYAANLSDGSDIDFYRVKTPKSATGIPEEMTVMAWTQQQPAAWSPTVSVFDAFGNAVAAQVLVNENGTYTIQIANAQPNANYYVAVASASGAPVSSNGTYFLGIDFGLPAANLQTFAAGTLTVATPADAGMLTVLQSQTFHFVLSADGLSAPADAAVQLTIADQYGNTVASVNAAAGSSQSVTLLLGPGQYTFSFSVSGQPSSISYSLLGQTLSDPIGPQLVNTSGHTITSSSGTGTYVWHKGYYSFMGLTY
jgi:hypothetical protein